MKNRKPRDPPVYDSTPNLDTFDKWVFEIKMCKISLGLNDK